MSADLEAFEGDSGSSTESPASPSTKATSVDGGMGLKEASSDIGDDLRELFSQNILAKSWRTATSPIGSAILQPGCQLPSWIPNTFPEVCPQEGPDAGLYVRREAEFWTCGFFPGQLALLLERLVKFPQSVNLDTGLARSQCTPNVTELYRDFKALCDIWNEPLHAMASRTDTHDIGFIIMPALRLDWELNGNRRSLDSIVQAARSLATRYVPSAGAIRSWDLVKKKDIEILDMEDNILVIIDSMCNLDLLYYASHHSPEDRHLADIATAHAKVVLQTHLRLETAVPATSGTYTGPWYSTCHVANLDPKTGKPKLRFSNQGYDHDSTWSRGQAWGILGYATTYSWTKDNIFLETACGLAEYFIHRIEASPSCVEVPLEEGQRHARHSRGRYVPLWDFDAPFESDDPLRDSSAGVIAANGLLVLSQALAARDENGLAARYRRVALSLVEDALDYALAEEKAEFSSVDGKHEVRDVVPGQTFEALLKYGTANNNQYARKRYANHGLVYGDYYLVEFGNRLLRMGLM